MPGLQMTCSPILEGPNSGWPPALTLSFSRAQGQDSSTAYRPLTVKIPPNTDANECHASGLAVFSPLEGGKRLTNLSLGY